MSDASTENDTGTSGSSGPDERLVPDEKLPEDLRPEENPLARDPEDEGEDAVAGDPTDPGPSDESLPDAGQPG